MRSIAVYALAFPPLFASACLSSGARRPDEPNRATEQFAFRFTEEAVSCLKAHPPSKPGQMVVAAQFTRAGAAPIVRDAGSVPGSEAALACTRSNVETKLHSPTDPPSRFVRVMIPIPVDLEAVRFRFVETLND